MKSHTREILFNVTANGIEFYVRRTLRSALQFITTLPSWDMLYRVDELELLDAEIVRVTSPRVEF